MKRFQYQATNSLGEEVTGEIVADSIEEVRSQLFEQDLMVESIHEVTEKKETEKQSAFTSPESFLELVNEVKEVTSTGVPLVVALRSFQEEAPSKKVSNALQRICMQLEQGAMPADVLSAEQNNLPTHFQLLLDAEIPHESLGDVLGEYLHQIRTRLDLKRKITLSLFYPAVLFVALFCLLMFFLAYLGPNFKKMFHDFDMELPATTRLIIFLSDSVLFVLNYWYAFLLPVIGLVIGIFFLSYLLDWDRRWRSNFSPFVPVIGASHLSIALSLFCHMMALFIENRVPLHLAIRLAAETTDDLPLIRQSKRLETLFRNGAGYRDVCALLETYPREFQQAFRMLGRGDAMAEAMHGAGVIYARQAQTSVDLLSVFLGPLMVCIIGISLVFLVSAMFMPLITLINGLS